MANFDEAYKVVMRNEGGYANDSLDRGGETYAGVARKFWPEWDGWTIVDSLKGSGFPGNLRKSVLLAEKVKDFYRKNFWGRYGEITSQKVACSLFDCAVNCGTVPANKMMQRALNIPVDGVWGKQSVKFANNSDEQLLLAKFATQRENYYRKIVERDPTQKKFLAGWLRRIDVA